MLSEQILETAQNIIAVGLALGVVVVNGFTDAPSTISGVVSSGVWSKGTASIICGIFNLLGVMVFFSVSGKVADSVFNSVDFGNYGTEAICASLCGVIIFSLVSWIFSMPSSESHALLSCMFGASMMAADDQVVFSFILMVLYMIFSCIFSVVFAFAFGKIFRKSSEECIKYEKISCILASFMHGGQDGQKFIGLLLFLTVGMGTKHYLSALFLCIAVAIFMLLGTLMCDKKIIASLGDGIVKNDKRIAFLSDFSSTVCIFLCSLLGFSVSTGNIKACSLVGAGLCENEKINYRTLKHIGIVSVITFPVCISLGYLLTGLFILLF
ncbi:MAG: inorganic phosphate transporter [Clostridia bacterium]|nr:inorganic phosphate transporter [Clostridia bacterium]